MKLILPWAMLVGLFIAYVVTIADYTVAAAPATCVEARAHWQVIDQNLNMLIALERQRLGSK